MSEHPIETLLALMQRHGIEVFEFEDGDRHVLLSAGDVIETADPVPSAPAPAKAGETIPAPHIGIFEPRHSLGDSQGTLPRLVRQGEIIGLLKAGGLLRPVLAPSDGILSRQFLETGALAGYGTALFEMHVRTL